MRAALLVTLTATLAFALSGCADLFQEHDNESVITVDYGGRHPEDRDRVTSDFVRWDDGDEPADELYRSRGLEHPDYYTAHDQLHQWMHEADVPVVASYNSQFGYFIEAIDGVEQRFTDTDGWFWSLAKNGVQAELGVSFLEVGDGDKIRWTYTYTEFGG